MRILYVYPEEWTTRRAREIQTLKTCVALADQGADVVLVTADGSAVERHAAELGCSKIPRTVRVVTLRRALGPVRSSALFARRLRRWLATQPPFTLGYVIHPKAAHMLATLGVPHWYEAHEVFAESTRAGSRAARRVRSLEHAALVGARGRIATGSALGRALAARYGGADRLDFAIVPNAGDPPLERSVADPRGPFVYAGSLANWKGLPIALEAAATMRAPVRVIGGTRPEWERLAGGLSAAARGTTVWHPRVAQDRLPEILSGCRAGLIPTAPASGSGRYSCPMKLFDYARCGLAVVVTDLPSLDDLGLGPWCRRVPEASVDAWKRALTTLDLDESSPLAWARSHTWKDRAGALESLFAARAP